MTAPRAAVIGTTCLLALAACSTAGSDDTTEGTGRSTEVEPHWTTIDVGDTPLPDRPIAFSRHDGVWRRLDLSTIDGRAP